MFWVIMLSLICLYLQRFVESSTIIKDTNQTFLEYSCQGIQYTIVVLGALSDLVVGGS